MDRCWDLDFENRITRGSTKQGVPFQPPTPLTWSPEGDSLDFEAELPSIMLVPLVWDMEDMYGASKGPRRFSRVVDTIKLDDFIQEFDTWSDMQ